MLTSGFHSQFILILFACFVFFFFFCYITLKLFRVWRPQRLRWLRYRFIVCGALGNIVRLAAAHGSRKCSTTGQGASPGGGDGGLSALLNGILTAEVKLVRSFSSLFGVIGTKISS